MTIKTKAQLRAWLREKIDVVQSLTEDDEPSPRIEEQGAILSELKQHAIDLHLLDVLKIVRPTPRATMLERLTAALASLDANDDPAGHNPVASDLFTVAQASVILNLAPRTVYDLCATGRLNNQRHGTKRGTIRISRKAIDNYLKQFA
jgi:excisionase family DNA binding protein